MNTVRYVIEKRFTSGTLKGLDHRDHIPFPDDEHAKSWREGVQKNSDAGKLNYVVKAFYKVLD